MDASTAGQVLLDAQGLVDGDRAKQHGDKLTNHEAIAGVWNGILEAAGVIIPGSHRLKGSDVANMMEGMKIARRYTGHLNRDDFVDGAGYAGVAYECAKREQDRRDSWIPNAAIEGAPAVVPEPRRAMLDRASPNYD